MRPKIGILSSVNVISGGNSPGVEQAYVDQEYISAIEKAGGIPIIIPFVNDETIIEKIVMDVDGVLVTGGADVCPSYYKEEPMTYLGFINAEQDVFHLHALKSAERHGRPIFGICRGLQLMNVAFGGSLYQDLSYRDKETIKHKSDSKRSAKVHGVSIASNSSLAEVFDEEIMVNSFHHQCIKELAKGFDAIAWAKDDVIEAIETTEQDGVNYKLAVQWHPESMTQHSDHAYKIFELFIQKIANLKMA